MEQLNLRMIVPLIWLLCLVAAEAQRDYIPLNGGFEEEDGEGSPVNWTLTSVAGPAGADTWARLVEDAWKGSRSLHLGSKGTGFAVAAFEAPIDFRGLRMLHLGTAEFHYKAVGSELGGANLRFEIELVDEKDEVVATAEHSPLAEEVGDGTWHTHRFMIDIRQSRMARKVRISFSVNAGDEKGPGEWMVDELQVYEKPSSISLGPLQYHETLVGLGEPVELSYEVSNLGGAVLYDLVSEIHLGPGLRTAEGDTMQAILRVEPEVDHEFVWNVIADEPGTYAISIETRSPVDDALPGGSLMVAVLAAAEFSHPPGRPTQAEVGESETELVLQNSNLRMVFPKSSTGYGLFGVQIWDEEWVDMGTAVPIGHALHITDLGSKEFLLLSAGDARHGRGASDAWVSLEGSIEDSDGVSWRLNCVFRLADRSSDVSITFNVQTSSQRRLLRLAGPRLLAGEGSFGSEREQAIFCGLEYLLGAERSSGTDFVHEPGNLRIVPHPLKVTIPLMAVEHANATIALSWDPLQRWDGQNQLPSAKFLSPNWLENQSNHLMEIFVPSVPVWVEENEDEASVAYEISGPITITTSIFVNTSDVLGAVRWWMEENGVPDVPAMPRSYEETLDLCTTSYKDIAWVPDSKAWKHTHRDDPGWIFWDTMVAVALWHHSALTENLTLREEIRAQVQEALDARGGWGVDMDLALHMGELDKALSSGYGTVRAFADTQSPDGSWPFTPSDDRVHLGTPGDTSSGWTASRARTLLKFGRITGDAEAIGYGLRALEYLDTQIRPEGAQTWELQLHVPDVLASSYIMECYLEAYKITGEDEYLEKAKYWAVTGLPFIYLWNPENRPVMRYGSIPVFGATHFTGLWFGIIVQWNGLDYAYKLLDLSRYDDELPWRTFAEGITICGMQMQRYPGGPYEEVLGMYPDAYSALKGDDAYYFDINPRFISLCVFGLMGLDETAQTEILEVSGQRIHISGVGRIGDAGFAGDTLSFESTYAQGDASYIITSGVSMPSSVRVSGRVIPEAADLSEVVEGWTYRSEGMVLVKLIHSSSDLVEVVGTSPHPNQRFSPEPTWEFDGQDTQGWTMINMLGPVTVSNGTLRTLSTGPDPYMHGPSIRVEARKDAVAELRMSLTGGSQAQIFWVSKESPGYSEPKSVVFQVTPDGEFHTYVVPLGESPEWKGTIRQLRLDPTNSGNAVIEVDYFRVTEVSVPILFGISLTVVLGGRAHGWTQVLVNQVRRCCGEEKPESPRAS